MSLIKKCLSHITQVLTHLFNPSLQTGKFLFMTKIARIVLLHKGRPVDNSKLLRLVSILINFRKTFETIMPNRIIKVCNDFNILSHIQFGFRAQR